MPLPPAYKVTAASVANKGEPFISGMHNSKEGVQAFLDKSEDPEATAGGASAETVAAETVAAAAGSGCSAGVDGGSDGEPAGGSSVSVSHHKWRVTDFLGPREMVAQQLPHLTYDDALPPILSFYSFATAEVVPVAAAE